MLSLTRYHPGEHSSPCLPQLPDSEALSVTAYGRPVGGGRVPGTGPFATSSQARCWGTWPWPWQPVRPLPHAPGPAEVATSCVSLCSSNRQVRASHRQWLTVAHTRVLPRGPRSRLQTTPSHDALAPPTAPPKRDLAGIPPSLGAFHFMWSAPPTAARTLWSGSVLIASQPERPHHPGTR